MQCLLKYGTEQIRGMVYEELKGEYGREKECEDWDIEKVSERKENSLSVVHELMKLLQITFLSCADSSMPSSL